MGFHGIAVRPLLSDGDEQLRGLASQALAALCCIAYRCCRITEVVTTELVERFGTDDTACSGAGAAATEAPGASDDDDTTSGADGVPRRSAGAIRGLKRRQSPAPRQSSLKRQNSSGASSPPGGFRVVIRGDGTYCILHGRDGADAAAQVSPSVDRGPGDTLLPFHCDACGRGDDAPAACHSTDASQHTAAAIAHLLLQGIAGPSSAILPYSAAVPSTVALRRAVMHCLSSPAPDHAHIDCFVSDVQPMDQRALVTSLLDGLESADWRCRAGAVQALTAIVERCRDRAGDLHPSDVHPGTGVGAGGGTVATWLPAVVADGSAGGAGPRSSARVLHSPGGSHHLLALVHHLGTRLATVASTGTGEGLPRGSCGCWHSERTLYDRIRSFVHMIVSGRRRWWRRRSHCNRSRHRCYRRCRCGRGNASSGSTRRGRL